MVKTIGTLILLCSLSFSNQQPGPCALKLTENQAIIQNATSNFLPFNDFISSLKQEIFEVDYVIDLIGLGLLAKEHILMFGSHGTAKSALMRIVGDNILMPDRKPSFYWHTVSEETSEAHVNGVLDPKALWDQSLVKLADQNALTNFRLGALNELFDGRPNALRLFLDSLQERMTQLGGFGSKPILEMILAGTNFYLPEVEEKAGKKAHALLDRFAFMVNVAEEFEEVVSSRRMMRRLRGGISPLYFNQLDSVRAIVPLVEVPNHVMDFITLLTHEWKQITERKENSSMRQFLEDKKFGRLDVMPIPPYRATRRTSKRTRDRARNVLQTWVAWESLKKNRPLVATIDDVKHLYRFFTLNSAPTEFLTEYQNLVVIPGEKRQLKTTLDERKDFSETHSEILSKVNSVGTLDWKPIDEALNNPNRTRHETSNILQVILKTALEANEKTETKTLKLSGEAIGNQRLVDEALLRLRRILPDTNASQEVLNHFRDASKEDLQSVSERILDIYANTEDPLGKLIDSQLNSMAKKLKEAYDISSPEEKIEFEKREQMLTERFGPRIITALKKQGFTFSKPTSSEPAKPSLEPQTNSSAPIPTSPILKKNKSETKNTTTSLENLIPTLPKSQIWTKEGPILFWELPNNRLKVGAVQNGKFHMLDTPFSGETGTYSVATKWPGFFVFIDWRIKDAYIIQYKGKKLKHLNTIRSVSELVIGSSSDKKIYAKHATGLYTSIDVFDTEAILDDTCDYLDSTPEYTLTENNPNNNSYLALGHKSETHEIKLSQSHDGFEIYDSDNFKIENVQNAFFPTFINDNTIGYWTPQGDKYAFVIHEIQ